LTNKSINNIKVSTHRTM